jgi:hypothetical protein
MSEEMPVIDITKEDWEKMVALMADFKDITIKIITKGDSNDNAN